MAESIVNILSALPWFAWIAVAAIVGSTISTVCAMVIKHRERMAMIHQGVHPDAPTAKPYEPEPCELS